MAVFYRHLDFRPLWVERWARERDNLPTQGGPELRDPGHESRKGKGRVKLSVRAAELRAVLDDASRASNP